MKSVRERKKKNRCWEGQRKREGEHEGNKGEEIIRKELWRQ